MKTYYAGIGSRETPPKILETMKLVAKRLREDGYTLRSGGAKGADSAFESEAHEHKQIFYAQDATQEAIEIASKYHPAWDRCNDFVRELHGRNAMILLGKDLITPVKFVVCWTKDGEDTGGTGLGIRIAQAYNIPIRNLYSPEVLNSLIKYIKRMR